MTAGNFDVMVPTSISYNSGSGSIAANGRVTFSGCGSISVEDVFTTDYENYIVIADHYWTTNSPYSSGSGGQGIFLKTYAANTGGANPQYCYLRTFIGTPAGVNGSAGPVFGAGAAYYNPSYGSSGANEFRTHVFGPMKLEETRIRGTQLTYAGTSFQNDYSYYLFSKGGNGETRQYNSITLSSPWGTTAPLDGSLIVYGVK